MIPAHPMMIGVLLLCAAGMGTHGAAGETRSTHQGQECEQTGQYLPGPSQEPLTGMLIAAFRHAGSVNLIGATPPWVGARHLTWHRISRTGSQSAGPSQSRARSTTARFTVLSSQPETSVYLNGAFRGRTDKNGRLEVARLPAGRYSLRARKIGFKEFRVEFRAGAGRTWQQRITLVATSDRAQLAFQEGEQWREEKGFEESLAEYQRALEQRPEFPEARIGLARSLLALNRYEDARQQAERAIRERTGRNPEGYAVLANALRGSGQYEGAVDAYRQALRQAANFSPEAHAGLAITLEFMDQPAAAIPHMREAIAQNGDAEPILYNLLGNMLLEVEKKQEAIQALETFLALAPESNLVPAIRSLVDQVREELEMEH